MRAADDSNAGCDDWGANAMNAMDAMDAMDIPWSQTWSTFFFKYFS
jgi:hypothetical protein